MSKKVERKDFSWTEVHETFVALVAAGFTVGNFKKMRNDRELLARMRIMADDNLSLGDPVAPLSFSQFISCVDSLTLDGRVVYVSLSEEKNRGFLGLDKSDRFAHDGFPMKTDKICGSMIAHGLGSRVGGSFTELNIRGAFRADRWNVVLEDTPCAPDGVKLFSISRI